MNWPGPGFESDEQMATIANDGVTFLLATLPKVDTRDYQTVSETKRRLILGSRGFVDTQAVAMDANGILVTVRIDYPAGGQYSGGFGYVNVFHGSTLAIRDSFENTRSRAFRVVNAGVSPDGRTVVLLVTSQNEGNIIQSIDRARIYVRNGTRTLVHVVNLSPTDLRAGLILVTNSGKISVVCNTQSRVYWLYSDNFGQGWARLQESREPERSPLLKRWHTFAGETLYGGTYGGTLIWFVNQTTLHHVLYPFVSPIYTASAIVSFGVHVLCLNVAAFPGSSQRFSALFPAQLINLFLPVSGVFWTFFASNSQTLGALGQDGVLLTAPFASCGVLFGQSGIYNTPSYARPRTKRRSRKRICPECKLLN